MAASRLAQTSEKSKNTIRRAEINTKLIQNVLLIWLDQRADGHSADCQNTINQLRRVVNTIYPFNNEDECVEFVATLENAKVCMLVSGSIGQHIVPCIHDMSQIDSIFIFCANQQYHERWSKEWPKVRGTFTDIKSICEGLESSVQQCERNSIRITFMKTNEDISNTHFNHVQLSFMYTQILKEIFLSIKFEQKHVNEFIQYCYNVLHDNEDELKNVKIFENYKSHTPIWWYTWNSFLHSILNRALRLMDVDVIIKLGFFIVDLHHHIEQLHNEQFRTVVSNKILTVYRGQGIEKNDFQKMMESKGGLLSFNCFLSTSKSRNISLEFVHHSLTNPDLVGILFIMHIDPSKLTTPYAYTGDVGCYGHKEKEILFSMHTIFRLGEIKSIEENPRLFQVDLILANENDTDLCLLTKRIREETEGATGWDQLGDLLLKMGQPEKAQQIYEILLEQTSEEKQKGRIYHQLAKAKYYQGKYKQALTFCTKALTIRKQSSSSNKLDLAKTYNTMGVIYRNMKAYNDALSSYEKTLTIQKQLLPSNHIDLATTYNNMGNVYGEMDLHLRALSSYEEALAIQTKSLPPNHPDLASSYNNIGTVYYNTRRYAKARSYYERALKIVQQSLPDDHPDVHLYKNNLKKVNNK